MRRLLWLLLSGALLLVAGCSSGPSAGPIISIFGPSPTLPPPNVGVTAAPDARLVVTQFLESLKNNDFTAMYALLSGSTQAAICRSSTASRTSTRMTAARRLHRGASSRNSKEFRESNVYSWSETAGMPTLSW